MPVERGRGLQLASKLPCIGRLHVQDRKRNEVTRQHANIRICWIHFHIAVLWICGHTKHTYKANSDAMHKRTIPPCRFAIDTLESLAFPDIQRETPIINLAVTIYCVFSHKQQTRSSCNTRTHRSSISNSATERHNLGPLHAREKTSWDSLQGQRSNWSSKSFDTGSPSASNPSHISAPSVNVCIPGWKFDCVY